MRSRSLGWVALGAALACAAGSPPQPRQRPPSGPQPPEVVLGLYSVPAEACSLVAAAGFTVVHSYAFETDAALDTTTFVLRARAYLDAAERCGLHALLGVPRPWLAAQRRAEVRAVLRGLRGHPALLAWYEDEIAQGGDFEAVRFFDQLVQAEDPAHGLAIEEAPADPRLLSLGRVRMFTYYPVTDTARRARRLQTLPERLPVQDLRVPFWPVLQAFGRDLVAGPAAHVLRVPTRDELQFTLCSALAAGARGIFFYPYLHPTQYDAAKARAGQWAYGGYRPLPELAPALWATVVECAALGGQLLELRQDAAPTQEVQALDLPPDVTMNEWQTRRGTLVVLANAGYEARCIVLTTRGAPARARFLAGSGGPEAAAIAGRSWDVDVAGPGGVALLLEPAP